ncbi:MAG: Holliday junction resolvase RuvX [Gammaproteobacteria bacterium]|nr:Holliday junction resolvase RuvX [Gammaproteobacteria bacterium]
MSKAPAVLLAFDFGAKRIGVAVGQSVTASARPLRTVRVSGRRPDWAAITDLVRTWQPTCLVVGLPLNMDGTEQETTHYARRFGRQLEARYHLPVHWVDERLSSVEAQNRLRTQGRPDDEVDPVAAQLILETWFSERAGAC